MSKFFYLKSTLAVAIIFTAVVFGYIALVFFDASKCFENPEKSAKMLALSFGFSADDVRAFLSIKTKNMLNCYIDFNTIWDNIFALLYGFMYVAWLSLSLKPFQDKFKWLNLLPFLQTIFDWLENMILSDIAKVYIATGQFAESDVQIGSIFNQAKWVVSLLVFLLIILGIAMRVKKWRKQKN